MRIEVGLLLRLAAGHERLIHSNEERCGRELMYCIVLYGAVHPVHPVLTMRHATCNVLRTSLYDKNIHRIHLTIPARPTVLLKAFHFPIRQALRYP
jgi:hypothetical protein